MGLPSSSGFPSPSCSGVSGAGGGAGVGAFLPLNIPKKPPPLFFGDLSGGGVPSLGGEGGLGGLEEGGGGAFRSGSGVGAHWVDFRGSVSIGSGLRSRLSLFLRWIYLLSKRELNKELVGHFNKP